MARVCFVGAGPGDPGLLTVRGRDLLARAGAVAFEAGLDERLLEPVPADAERIVIAPGANAAGTVERLAEAARARGTVVRLGRGEPFGLGAAVAEAAALERAGVEVMVVPGVSFEGGAGAAVRWLEARPLFGWTVVVTRPRAQAAELVRLLVAPGAAVRAIPLIRVEAPPDEGSLRSAVRSLGTFDWVVFTSANGVDRFWAVMEAEALDARALGAARVACIGPGTAEALARRGVRPDLVPAAYVAEALLDALAGGGDLRGTRVLLPRSAGGRPVLPDGLRARGAEVADIEAYSTVPETAGEAELRDRITAGVIDALTFASPSAVDSYVDAAGAAVGRALVAVIGPVTAARARARGLPVHVEAEEHTAAGLAAALAARALEERRAGRRV